MRTLGWVAAGLLAGGCVEGPAQRLGSHAVLAGWSESDWANMTLDLMVEKYGPPTRIEVARVVWENKGPWKRIAVWDGLGFFETNAGAANNIEETIAYWIPPGERDALKDFSELVKASSDGAELSARSSSEERNFLALNLADEVVHGIKTPEEARRFYALTLRLAEAGKSSPYMQGLRIKAPPLPAAP